MKSTRRDFIAHLGLGMAGLAIPSVYPSTGWATDFGLIPNRTFRLPRAMPEAQGVASGGLVDFVNAVEKAKLNLHSLMVVRHGQVIAEGWWAPYAPTFRHTLYSLSKSFTSTAVGMAVADKKLTVEDKVISFFPKEVPATVSDNLAAMRVRDLLTMSTGHDKDTTPALSSASDKNWIKAFLAQPVDHKPGTHFVYNSGATYMLSAIVQKLTGLTVLQYLKPRLFDPLGIEGEDWEVDPNGINTGGWGLRVKTEDIAKFGQLYLQKGVRNGKQLIPEAWVADATRSHVQSAGGTRKAAENDWLQGYGYQFWRCRNEAYRGDGAFGQFCIVLPKEDAVVAITSETANMQGILDEVWHHVLPALQGKEMAKDVKSAQAQLKRRMTSLAFMPPAIQVSSPLAAQVSGKTYTIESNSLQVKAITWRFRPTKAEFTIRDEQGEHEIVCGLSEWMEGRTNLSQAPLKLTSTSLPNEGINTIYASGTWTDDKTFSMIWRFIETAHYETVTCRFQDDSLQVEFRSSLSLLTPNGKDKRPVLKGNRMA